MALIKIKNDLFFMAERLKEIDDGYFIAFNTKTSKFEIHNSKQPYSTFCLLVPNNKLNPSLIEYVRKTRSENQKKLIKEMEEANQKLENHNKKQILDEAEQKFEELLFSKEMK